MALPEGPFCFKGNSLIYAKGFNAKAQRCNDRKGFDIPRPEGSLEDLTIFLKPFGTFSPPAIKFIEPPMTHDAQPTNPAPSEPPAPRRISAVTLFTFGLITICILGAILICGALIYSSQP
jgi:hypothetical protein